MHKVQAKNLHFGSVMAFQIGINLILKRYPLIGLCRVFYPMPSYVIFHSADQLRILDGLLEIYEI
jgi:hypothetical protein